MYRIPENLRLGLAGGLEEAMPTASEAPLLGSVRWDLYPALRATQRWQKPCGGVTYRFKDLLEPHSS